MTTTATATQSAETAPRRTDQANKLTRQMTNRWLMRSYMLSKLPLGFFAGLRVDELDAARCTASVPYGWMTTNPFRSTYFAAQAMAAEMSTGALAMLAVRSAPASVAMLITGLEAEFGKKATDRAFFTCTGGDELFAAVARTVETGEAATATVTTIGKMADGTEVARFSFTWSFKRRSRS
ncbi:MAG: DUF4442 domain-containing protein [Acidobacteriota bacterium]